jgi:hypothetical protein
VPWVPEADGLAADGDTAFSQEIFDIPVAEIEPEVEPDCIGNDIGWEAETFTGIHQPILSKPAL